MPERVAVEVGRSGGSPVGSQCDAVEEAAVSNAPELYSSVAVDEIARHRRGADTPGVAIDAEPLGRVAGEVASVTPVMTVERRYGSPVCRRLTCESSVLTCEASSSRTQIRTAASLSACVHSGVCVWFNSTWFSLLYTFLVHVPGLIIKKSPAGVMTVKCRQIDSCMTVMTENDSRRWTQ